MTIKQFVRGVNTKIYYTVLATETLQDWLTGPIVPPDDVNITTGAAIIANATSITVTALGGPIPAGTAIELTQGSNKLVVTTSASVATGATSIPIYAAQGALNTAATGTYVAKLLLVGGTNSQRQITNGDTEVQIYQDATSGGYKDGSITNAMAQVTYNYNFLNGDLGFSRLLYTAMNAIDGVRGYLWHELEPPAGYEVGHTLHGLVDLMEFPADAPAEGLVTGNTTFKFRGKPTEVQPLVTAP